MEKNGKTNNCYYKQQQMGEGCSSSSYSSIATELFGPKVSSKSSTSSSGLFESVFGPSSVGLGRQFTHTGVMYSNNTKSGTPDGATQRGSMDSKSNSSMFETSERVEWPCNFSSSIYYGAQDVYFPITQTTCSPHIHFKKDEGEDDENGNNSNGASRGNWWQGSLYY